MHFKKLFTGTSFFSNMKICYCSWAGERGNWRKLEIVKPTFNLLLARDRVGTRGFAHLDSIPNRIFYFSTFPHVIIRIFSNCNTYLCMKGESPEKL